MYQIILPITPPKMTSQQKGIFRLPSGKMMVYTKPEIKKIRSDLSANLLEHKPKRPFNGPLLITIILHWPFRKSERKEFKTQGWRWHTVKPDCDNSAKIILDVLESLRFFKSDARVSRLVIEKQWRDKGMIQIHITELEEKTKT